MGFRYIHFPRYQEYKISCFKELIAAKELAKTDNSEFIQKRINNIKLKIQDLIINRHGF